MDKLIISKEEYDKLKYEHLLLAILRANGIEELDLWIKSINELKEGKLNGYY